MYIRKLHHSFMRAAQLLVLRDFSTEEDVWKDIDVDASYIMIQPYVPRLIGCLLVDTNKYLAYLVVHEEYRHKKVASRLMAHCTATSLTCEARLLPFYERFGFSAIGLEPDGRVKMVLK